ncbi:LPXTG cell wall anchor domain-containing protein, partial [Streptomyces eurythermus]|uniref:LPXTG cell wall anchor domain-containing protein n=1 Tax=Streptomyces eurythermus TaxID=42237 RepID=UPI0033DBA3C2
SFPSGQTISTMWGGTPTQNGASVTVAAGALALLGAGAWALRRRRTRPATPEGGGPEPTADEPS